MLNDPGRTQYDLNFRILGFHCRVHPLFWLLAAILFGSLRFIDQLIIWVAVVFVSVLVHELGHALTMRYWGARVEIALTHFGGLAIPTHAERDTWRSIAISVAGPGAGFLLLGLTLAVDGALAASYGTKLVSGLTIAGWLIPDYWLGDTWIASAGMIRATPESLRITAPGMRLAQLILFLVQVNTLWGLLNLLPIVPLDGGRVSQALFARYLPSRGMEYTFKLSILCAAAAAAWFLVRGPQLNAILFLILAFFSYQGLSRLGRYDYRY